ncbi:hypothetical protein Ade02nite_70430 [Paractinoplanes deccanensis]|uniref:Uncharacterized protein n=1 Tax=Paractinoplanes deccanensis TaxID=113561 RepID=A0ABQ3YEJ2_9ACTN|nr:hypothetical protein [Actinoplanes deccanensis]GID78402.1 hypothetical protein Ade02nite_70430 [Actinoplanes deccanensis]
MEKQGLGLPWIALAGLALLAVPRVVLHDLDVVQEGDAVNLLLVFVPLVIWIVVAVLAKVPRPFLTLLVVGAIYGVFLALVHQLLWDRSVGAGAALGGNLEGRLPPGAEEFVIRTFAVVSSLFTGLLAGAVTGLVAWGASRALGRTPARPRE